ncbi:hypothetical protein [Enhydrobacter sp.]|jgi:hypothetical protein|uniref:hypothetical protein n=1 Tax=Enhydrobacter sp. TaxID=1894999 RepID=UPI002624DF6E|nr:hypothetical protein [Enhydrobacter sp.]WIM10027.1 MAG: hypothetical protein OJF58_000980 [Enhydrobacter sp.]
MIPRTGNRSWRHLLTAALAGAAIVVTWSQLAHRSEHVLAREPGMSTTLEPKRTSWGTSVGFVDEQRLDEHYRKHGAEFGHITKLDYLHQAQLLRDTAVGGPVLETVRHDGVVTRFDRQTGAFVAFNRDGTIRTFFKPNDGERYYRRQAERGE